METTLKGTKLIFTKSKSVYKNKTGSRPKAKEIFNGEEVTTTEGSGNRFAALANICVSVNGSNGTHDGSEDDGEHWASRLLLKELIVNDVDYTLVVVSRWYCSKIGPRLFKRINEVGLSATRNMSGSTIHEPQKIDIDNIVKD